MPARRRPAPHPAPAPLSPLGLRLAAILNRARLEDAAGLQLRTSGAGVWHCSGGKEPHYVTFGERFECDCGHAINRDALCKHILRVVLSLESDEVASVALRQFGLPALAPA